MGSYTPDKNVGLVSHDEAVVYEELGQWMKRTNALAEATHHSAHWITPLARQLPHQALQRFVPTVDGNILEWPQELAIRPTVVNTLLDHAWADHTYFISWDEKYLYLAGDMADSHLESSPPGLAWDEGDYLSIHLGPVSLADARVDYPTAIFISPSGGGADGQQPYATRWFAAEGYRQIALRVEKRLRSGVFTTEARIPVTAIVSFQTIHGASWKIKLIYQNVNEIYQMQWEGRVTLRP